MTLPPNSARLLTVPPETFLADCRADMQRAREGVAALKAMNVSNQRERALDLYDDAVVALGNASARASLARNVHPSEPMRSVAETAEQEIDALATELALDRGLYDTLSTIGLDGADPATRWFLEKTLRDFRRAGVDRDEAIRARVKTLREELVRIGQEFGKNIKDDVRSLGLDPRDLAEMGCPFYCGYSRE